jgi:hypothetical protein
MVILYLDNFRGFSKTLIPLKPVNFLIGENSTGKSSILALVNLLCSPDFWFMQNFNLPDYEFGGFHDILSATAKKTNHFTIGFFRKRKDNKTKSETLDCYVLSYIERDALPMIDFVARTDGQKLLVIRSIKGKYKFKSSTIHSKWINKEASNLFNLLSSERDRNLSGFQELPKKISSKASFVPILAMLDFIASEGNFRDDEISFPFPLLTPDLVWFAPIRTRPRRTYDGYGRQFSPEGEHTPYLLRKRLSEKKPTAFRKAIEAFGKASGLFYEVVINRLGKDAAAPFELLVELAPKCPLRVNSVGYGVSQVLPLVVEMLARRNDSWFAIQQPEVHLHPKAQAALGDMLFHLAETDSKHFLVETHSDFTVDRFRMNFKKKIDHKTSAQVLFFERTNSGNQVHPIPILADGEYPDDQPAEFRKFFLQEQMSLLGL